MIDTLSTHSSIHACAPTRNGANRLAASGGLRPMRVVQRLGMALAASAAFAVQALGVGQPQVHSTLGQPLNMSFELSLSANEPLIDACVRADVVAGDARVPAGLLQVRLEGDTGQPPSRIRLTSLARIDEPVLQISLALGCPSRFTREFVAMVEPQRGGQASQPAVATTAAAPVPSSPPVSRPPVRSADQPDTQTASTGTVGLVAVRAVPSPAASSPQREAVRRRAQRPKPVSQPRLQLEAPEILAAAPRPAASAPTEPGTNEAELEATLARLEQMVAQLQADLKSRAEVSAAAAAAAAVSEAASAPTGEVASEASAASAPPQVAASAAELVPVVAPAVPVAAARPPRYSDPLSWLWTLALSLFAGVIAYQWGVRQEQLRRRRRAEWARQPAPDRVVRPPEATGLVVQPEAAAVSTHAASTVVAFAPAVQSLPVALPSDGRAGAPPQPKAMPWPAGSGAAATLPGAFPMTLPDAGTAGSGGHGGSGGPQGAAQPSAAPVAAAAMGADGLLDLQQQLEFLGQLGQQDAAADLLTARVKQESGGPMPYLLLMEMCQQRGEPQAFAELARRFERRFGGLAPDWTSSLTRGRNLDSSPSVVAHLQVVWSEPAAALAMLRELVELGAGPGASSFELPAYRDLLLLYAVARDHYEADQRSEGVDFELPDTGAAPL